MKSDMLSVKMLIIFTILFMFSINGVNGVPSTIYVDSSGNDSWSGENPAWNGTDGPKKSIKNAIQSVNVDGIVKIKSGTYKENNIFIYKNLTIQGENRANTIIDAQYHNRVFTIQTGCTVKLSNLKIINGYTYNSGGAIYSKGHLNISNSDFSNNKAPNYYGGAISSAYYSLLINNCTFSNNKAKVAGAISGTYTSLNIKNSYFSYNKATNGAGGAIVNSRGSLILYNNKFSCNSATNGFGGAFYNTKGYLNVNNNKFYYNTAPEGGAIYTEDNKGNVYLTLNTFLKNTANNGRGGALYHCHGTLIATKNNFTGNRATINGGGIYIDSSGLPSVSYSTIVMNGCNFTNNSANKYGGAIYNHGTLKITNTSFTTNNAFYVKKSPILFHLDILLLFI